MCWGNDQAFEDPGDDKLWTKRLHKRAREEMTNLKIIIPMAGLGKRLGPLTRHKPKSLVRLAEKRLLDHVLDTFEQLRGSYTLEYIFIIGYLGEQIRDHIKDTHPEKKVTYYVQEQFMGQSHAVYLAKDAMSGPVLVTFCDAINQIDLSFLPVETMDAVVSVQEVNDPRSHGVAMVDPGNRVTMLVEKPKTMENKLALTGMYYFSEGENLLKGIETQMERGKLLNNELYLADAINILLEKGAQIRYEKVSRWLDAGTPDAMLTANAYLLQDQRKSHTEILGGQSSLFIDPVFVHESSRIESSIIGPNVSIGADCVVKQSLINNTIIDDNSRIAEVRLVDSLIGKGCSVRGSSLPSIMADYEEIRIDDGSDISNVNRQVAS